MKDIWKEYAADFNAMTDEEVDREAEEAQEKIDRETAWVEAVAAWKAAGKPRRSDTSDKPPLNGSDAEISE